MKITVLIDNKKKDPVFQTEHGLSILIEYNGYTVLFDTGKTDAFMHNAQLLGKDLTKVDYVVLSHSHYDHTGGLEAFLIHNKTAKVILKKEVLKDRYSVSYGYNRKIGFPLAKRFEQLNNRYIFVEEAQELFPDFWVFPQIIRATNQTYSDTLLFMAQKNDLVPDNFDDELFLTAIHHHKLIIFTGCAHNGIENMVDTAITHTQLTDVEFIIGGTHLNRASKEQLDKTIINLSKYNIQKAAFNHCSGIQNIPALNNSLKGEIEYAYTGMQYIL